MAEMNNTKIMEELERRTNINKDRLFQCKHEIENMWNAMEIMNDRMIDLEDELELKSRKRRKTLIPCVVSMVAGIVIGKLIGDGTVAYFLQKSKRV